MIQTNLRTGNERRMRPALVHASQLSIEGQPEVEPLTPSNPRRHSAPAITQSTTSKPAVVVSGIAAVPTVFRRQNNVREDQMC